ncbi:hypothetical protein [Okeania sp. SIO2B3]|uniref:hypothetical protein n=1 Tax=Okeania sp. SIO2B3 TaxID=2607784 RepID=UPI0013C045DF|nr:hypothetical protein [Okeania sp. SIO2B3]NET43109.1 hypothetical protein [Okeania sp. SIO2B3]
MLEIFFIKLIKIARLIIFLSYDLKDGRRKKEEGRRKKQKGKVDGDSQRPAISMSYHPNQL